MEQFSTFTSDYASFVAGRRMDLAPLGIQVRPEGLRRMAGEITANPTMLPKDEHNLHRRYEDGILCVLYGRRSDGSFGDEAIGTVTYEPLMDGARLATMFPDVARRYPLLFHTLPALYELGAVNIDPAYQGRGLSHLIHDALLRDRADEIRSGKLLVVLTTQNAREILTYEQASEPSETDALVKRVGFRTYLRGDLPGIDVFTCTCSSDYKVGYGVSNECPAAARVIERPVRPYMIRLLQEGVDPLPCYIGVSSGAYAAEYSNRVMSIGRALVPQGTPQEQLDAVVTRLREDGYYT